MKFRTDDSLADRLSRIRTGRDSSNWLTEAIPPRRPGGFKAPAPGWLESEPTDTGNVGNAFGQKTTGDATGAIRRGIGDGIGQLFKQGFARLNDQIDWSTLNTSTKDLASRARNYAAHSVAYARQLGQDINDSGPKAQGWFSPLKNTTPDNRTSLNLQEIRALSANAERNKELFGSFTKDEMQTLDPEIVRERLSHTQALVQSTRPFQFDEDFIETSFQLIRDSLGDKAFRASGGRAEPSGVWAGVKAGSKPGKDIFFQDDDEEFASFHEPKEEFKEDGVTHTKEYKAKKKKWDKYIEGLSNSSIGQLIRGGGKTAARAKLAWKLYLEQGGREALTGLPLDPQTMQIEHTFPYNAWMRELDLPDRFKDEITQSIGASEGEDYDAAVLNKKNELFEEITKMIDNPANFVLLNEAVNNAKSNRSIEDLYSTRVDPFSNMSEDEYEKTQGVEDQASAKLKKLLDKRGAIGGKTGTTKLFEGDSDSFIQQILPLFLDPEGNIVESEFLPEIADKIDEFESLVDSVRDEIVDLYPGQRLYNRQQRDGDPRRQEPFDPRIAKAISGSSGIGSSQKFSKIKDRLTNDIFNVMNFSRGWKMPGRGATWDQDFKKDLLRRMFSDENITERNGSWRDMWNGSKKRVQALQDHLTQSAQLGRELPDDLPSPHQWMEYLIRNKYGFNPDNYNGEETDDWETWDDWNPFK